MNSKLDHPVEIGLLGKLLIKSGLTTAIRGNEDEFQPRRAARLIFGNPTDFDGATITNADSSRPFGTSFCIPTLTQLMASNVTLIDFGDIARIDRFATKCLPEVADKHRANALEKLDQLLAMLNTKYTCDRLVLFAPVSAESAETGDRLAPLLIWGDGIVPGLISSPSTHIAGLAVNTDLLPSILQFYGIARPTGIDGQPLTFASSISVENVDGISTNDWYQMHRKWMSQSRMQSRLGGFPTVQTVAILFVGIIAVWSTRKKSYGVEKIWMAGAIPVILPFALLVLPIFGIGNAVIGELLTAILVVVGAITIARSQNKKLLIIFLRAFLALMLLDMFTGCHLLSHAWMSYSIMEGARYYGIGNEYAGTLFALTLCVVGAQPPKSKSMPLWARVMIMLVVLIATGAPMFGAKAGSVLGMAIGFGIAGIVWWRGALKAVYVLVAVPVALAALGGMLGIDLILGGKTHIARALLNGGSLTNIALRKLELNGYLLLHSVWSIALFSADAALYFVWKKSHLKETSDTRGTISGLISGVIALLLFNDAGVISAALALLMFTGVLALNKAQASPVSEQ